MFEQNVDFIGKDQPYCFSVTIAVHELERYPDK